MSETNYTILKNRGVLEISGEDRKAFLQGLISNNVDDISENRAIYAALLTPQGKYLFDFFISEISNSLYLDCELNRLDELIKKLSIYKLRADINLVDRSNDYIVGTIYGETPIDLLQMHECPGKTRSIYGGKIYVDPRIAAVGFRLMLPREQLKNFLNFLPLQEKSEDSFDYLRIMLGLPDGSRDLIPEKSILLENGFNELNGIDWNKGCYMGQELTARTKYRGLIKKRLVPAKIMGPTPLSGATITKAGRKVGEMRSSLHDIGLALIRTEHICPESLNAGNTELLPMTPNWVKL